MTVKKITAVILSLIFVLSVAVLPAGAEEIESVTIHYFNENNWEDPYIYCYSGSNSNKEWPGEAMTAEGDGWYTLKVYGYLRVNVIFSDNGKNQYPGQNESGIEIVGEMWYYKGELSSSKPERISNVIHYYNENNWSTPYVYYYSDDNEPVTWPGVPMSSEGGNWYAYTITDMAAPKVVFSNNGSDQNPPQNEQGYEVNGEKWYLNGTFYDSEPEGITVHYHNYDNWDTVNIYYYDGDRTGSDWTGNPMTADGGGWYTYKIYGFDMVKVLFNNGGDVQIPGRLEPGFDVAGEMWYRNGEWFTECPDGIKIYFYNPEGWGTPNIYYYLNDNDTGKAWPGEEMDSEGDNWYSFTITKYDSAKVLFNSGSNQIPAQNQPGLDASGIMWYKDGVWCDRESDADNDELPDYMEMFLGTDVHNADSDGDGLPDGMEVFSLGTDPLKADSDGNGVNDGAEDPDGDGLTNVQEYTFGSDPMVADSDGDGLTDGEEVNIYHTDPMNVDTDGDGLSDYNEVKYGFDPLACNSSFSTSLSYEGKDVVPTVTLNNINGDQLDTLQIEPVENYLLLDERVPGYIDCAFEFSMSGDFEQAVISFEFDSALLQDETFVPRIYYYDEEKQLLEELPDQTVTGNVVSVATTHFSKYILLNKTEFDIVWNSEIKPPNDDPGRSGLDVVFVIDSSGSMVGNDRNNVRLEAAKAFVDRLGGNDNAAVIDFDTRAIVTGYFTSDHEALYDAIDKIDSRGGTDLRVGVNYAIDLFTNDYYTQRNAYKYIILLTDGNGAYDSQYTTLAAQNDIVIYTIGLGSDINSSVLNSIANGTGGKYYFAQTADYLVNIYDEIAGDTIDYTTDSNNDGISDYFTKLLCDGDLLTGTGISIFDVALYDDLQYNDDYDFDGLSNGEEVEVVFDEFTGKVFIRMYSSPTDFDGDGDGLDDLCEYLIGTNALDIDCDGDGLTDGQEVSDWYDPLNADPDGDGRSDRQEKEEHTDPFSYNKDWKDYTEEFVEGFLAGDFIQDTDSMATMLGQVLSGFTEIADIRDFIADLAYGDYLMAGLNISGFLIEAEDAPEAVIRTGKVILTKTDDLAQATDLVRFIKKHIPQVVDKLGDIQDFKDFADLVSEKINSNDYSDLTREKSKELLDLLRETDNADDILTTSSLPYKEKIRVDTDEYGNPLKDGLGNPVNSVWECNPKDRGHAIDEALNQHWQGVGLGRSFPFVDRLDESTKELISTKSIDVCIAKYCSPGGVRRTLNRDFELLYSFELNWHWHLQDTDEKNHAIKTWFIWDESNFKINDYETKVLEIALPDDEIISVDVYNAFYNSLAVFENSNKFVKYQQRIDKVKGTAEDDVARRVESMPVARWFVLVE